MLTMDQMTTTGETTSVGAAFVQALTASDPTALEALLTPDVGLREYATDHLRGLRGRDKVVRHFQDDRAAAPDMSIELLSAVGDEERVAVEYRVQYTLDDRYVEDFRAAFLRVRDGQVAVIDAYRTAPYPSAHRQGWIAPATLSDEQISHLFEEWEHGWDIREWLPPTMDGWGSLHGTRGGSGDPHPGSNGTDSFHWPAEVADQKIEEIIDTFRARGVGFTWRVSPFDEPRDLAERLERHGLILAGDHVAMARIGLEPSGIPVNPAVEIEVVDGSREEAIDDMLAISAACFHWTPEQVAERRPGYLERARDPKVREKEASYIAYLDGRAVGYGRILYVIGIAYMGGAAVLPEARGHKVYSTLLARRLADAHARGYHIAGIHAAPMSRPIVARYGFKPYARFLVYGWMPEPDLAVIKSLVPQE